LLVAIGVGFEHHAGARLHHTSGQAANDLYGGTGRVAIVPGVAVRIGHSREADVRNEEPGSPFPYRDSLLERGLAKDVTALSGYDFAGRDPERTWICDGCGNFLCAAGAGEQEHQCAGERYDFTQGTSRCRSARLRTTSAAFVVESLRARTCGSTRCSRSRVAERTSETRGVHPTGGDATHTTRRTAQTPTDRTRATEASRWATATPALESREPAASTRGPLQ